MVQITPTTRRERAVLAAAHAAGLYLAPVGERGAVRLWGYAQGQRVDVSASALGLLHDTPELREHVRTYGGGRDF